jgi:S1-C subfamily serine protease
LIRTLLAAALSLALASTAFARTKDDRVIVTADPVIYLEIGHDGDCTGFAADVFDQQAIITAGHCAVDAIKNHDDIMAQDSIGRSFKVGIIYLDAAHDVAVLGVPEGGKLPGPIASIPLGCNAKLTIGEDVSMTGYPVDFGKVTTFGKVSALGSPMGWWANVLRIQMYIAPGNSGSAVVNGDGQVIGIGVGHEPENPGLALVVPITEVCHPEVM